MTTIESLQRALGSWQGISRLYLHEEPMRETPATAEVTPAIQGTFMSLAYTWAFDGKPQEGLLLLAKDPAGDAVKCLLLDSFHMNESFMVCTGQVDAEGAVNVRGSYSVEGYGEWGWRIHISGDDAVLKIAMFNISPEGQEYPGFDVDLTRA